MYFRNIETRTHSGTCGNLTFGILTVRNCTILCRFHFRQVHIARAHSSLNRNRPYHYGYPSTVLGLQQIDKHNSNSLQPTGVIVGVIVGAAVLAIAVRREIHLSTLTALV